MRHMRWNGDHTAGPTGDRLHEVDSPPDWLTIWLHKIKANAIALATVRTLFHVDHSFMYDSISERFAGNPGSNEANDSFRGTLITKVTPKAPIR